MITCMPSEEIEGREKSMKEYKGVQEGKKGSKKRKEEAKSTFCDFGRLTHPYFISILQCSLVIIIMLPFGLPFMNVCVLSQHCVPTLQCQDNNYEVLSYCFQMNYLFCRAGSQQVR